MVSAATNINLLTLTISFLAVVVGLVVVDLTVVVVVVGGGGGCVVVLSSTTGGTAVKIKETQRLVLF